MHKLQLKNNDIKSSSINFFFQVLKGNEELAAGNVLVAKLVAVVYVNSVAIHC